MKTRFIAVIFGLLTLATLPRVSEAWDGTVTGKIVRIDATSVGIRVYLQGSPVICSTHTWAYLDDIDANYKVFVSALLTAKAMGSDVIVFTNIDSGSGFCRIGYIAVGA